jgi:hypothetical protein
MKPTVPAILLFLSVVACSTGTHNESASPKTETHSKATFTKVPDSLNEMNDCNADNECIIVDGGCGNPMAISSKYREAAQAHLLQIYAAVDCAAPSEQADPSIAICQENICQVAH